MATDYDCSSEFQPCTNTCFVICCLKIANTHTHTYICRHRGVLISSEYFPVVHRMKNQMNISPWQFSVSAFLSWRGNLWGYLGLVSRTYLWDVFVAAKASSEKHSLIWEQKVGRCVEDCRMCVILPLGLRWVFKISSTQTHRLFWWLISLDY